MHGKNTEFATVPKVVYTTPNPFDCLKFRVHKIEQVKQQLEEDTDHLEIVFWTVLAFGVACICNSIKMEFALISQKFADSNELNKSNEIFV